MFLDYAEAANEAVGPEAAVAGSKWTAKSVIKSLRERAGICAGVDDPYLNECAQNKDKMRELIRNERRLELCFENHRFYDLRRWQVDLNKLNEQGCRNQCPQRWLQDHRCRAAQLQAAPVLRPHPILRDPEV